jgi:hypothetical protein
VKKIKDQVNNFKQFKHGSQIERMILTNDEYEVEKAMKLLHDDINAYRQGKFKKWIIMIIGLVFAYPVG